MPRIWTLFASGADAIGVDWTVTLGYRAQPGLAGRPAEATSTGDAVQPCPVTPGAPPGQLRRRDRQRRFPRRPRFQPRPRPVAGQHEPGTRRPRWSTSALQPALRPRHQGCCSTSSACCQHRASRQPDAEIIPKPAARACASTSASERAVTASSGRLPCHCAASAPKPGHPGPAGRVEQRGIRQLGGDRGQRLPPCVRHVPPHDARRLQRPTIASADRIVLDQQQPTVIHGRRHGRRCGLAASLPIDAEANHWLDHEARCRAPGVLSTAIAPPSPPPVPARSPTQRPLPPVTDAVRAPSACSKAEQARLLLGACRGRPGIADGWAQLAGANGDTTSATSPVSVNLIALPTRFSRICCTRVVAMQRRRYARRDLESRNARPLALRERAHQPGDVVQQRTQRRNRRSLIPAFPRSARGPAMRRQPQQVFAGVPDRIDCRRCRGSSSGITASNSHPSTPVIERAHLVAERGERDFARGLLARAPAASASCQACRRLSRSQ